MRAFEATFYDAAYRTKHPILLRVTRLLDGRRASGFVQVALC
jgi:hypothetical protein